MSRPLGILSLVNDVDKVDYPPSDEATDTRRERSIVDSSEGLGSDVRSLVFRQIISSRNRARVERDRRHRNPCVNYTRRTTGHRRERCCWLRYSYEWDSSTSTTRSVQLENAPAARVPRTRVYGWKYSSNDAQRRCARARVCVYRLVCSKGR